MRNRAKLVECPRAGLVYGLVAGPAHEGWWVETGDGRCSALAAVSCLIQPRPGDTVLMAVDPEQGCFILSVLKRGDDTAGADLVFSGPVSLHVQDGDLALSADRDMRIAAGREMGLAAGAMKVHADEAEARLGDLSLIGRFIHTQADRVRTVAATVDQIVQSLTQRLEESWRYIRGHEEVQCESTRLLAEDSVTVQTRNALHQAEELHKIDAGQIHLG